jgi:signal transduction histidine kinase
MIQYPVYVQSMRNCQLNRGIYACAILGFIALVGSLGRMYDTGWHNIMYLHIIIYMILLSMCVLSKRLSFRIRSVAVISAFLFLGVGSVFSRGLIGFGLPMLCLFPILSTIFYGTRAGIIATVLSICIMGLISIGVYKRVITFGFSANMYLTSMSSWLSTISSMILAVGVIVVILGTLSHQLLDLIHRLDKNTVELQEANTQLLLEIQERKAEEVKRQQIEKKLRQAEKMETIGLLAGGVAHDLNNVLTAVIGYPDLLLMQISQNDPVWETVKTIQTSGLKAAAIVQDLLILARRGVVVTRPVNLNDIVDEYQNSAEYKTLKSYHPGVEIKTNLDNDLVNTIGSPIHLFKVMMNLFSNAAEAMPKGGTLYVSTETRHVAEPIKSYEDIQAGDYAVLKVKDTGTGIATKDLRKIFEPFYTKKVMGRSGTGLGMAIVWGTVKDHKGYIDVQSTENKGTLFTIYFPASNQKIVDKKCLLAFDEYRGNGESILVVDDIKEQRDLTFKMLSALGYSVKTLPSGEEAVEYLKHDKADLLILDMIMEPNIDGLDTYRKIIKQHPGQKAFITSGFSETKRVIKAKKLGVASYLKKPYQLQQIGLAIREALG